MKPSQIALLSVGGVLAAIIIVTAVSARVALSRSGIEGFDADRIPASSELRGFNELEVSGRWHVNVKRGEGWQVALSHRDDLEDAVRVQVRGDRLRLGTRRSARRTESAHAPVADIVMPELEELDLRGTARIELSGFRGDDLSVDVAGAVRLEANDGRYDELELSVAGASEVDLKGLVVTDAEVDLAGASNVILTMGGGELSGSMAGAGRIEYYGSVSRETVEIAGVGRIVQRGR